MAQYVATDYWTNGYAVGDTNANGADATHGHTADQPSLIPAAVCAPNDALHGHSAAQPLVNSSGGANPDEARSTHTADQPVMIADAPASINEAGHGHTADQPAITFRNSTVVDSALHAHTADAAPALGDAFAQPDSATHAHAADIPAINADAPAVIDSAIHSHTADQSTIIFRNSTVVDGALHAHAADAPTVTFNEIQNAYPDEDVSNTGWQASAGNDLFAMIDEPDVPNDSDFIFATATGDIFEVGISPLPVIGDDTSHQIFPRVRGNGTNSLRIRLKEGVTVISTWTISSPPATETTYTLNVTPAEAATIVNYENLSIEGEVLA